MIPSVDAAALIVGEHRHVAQSAEDDDVLADRGEWREHRRELEGGPAVSCRVEIRQVHPVRHVEKAQTLRRGRRRRERRPHGIEPRQRDGGTDTTKKGPSRHRHLGDDHRLMSFWDSLKAVPCIYPFGKGLTSWSGRPFNGHPPPSPTVAAPRSRDGSGTDNC